MKQLLMLVAQHPLKVAAAVLLLSFFYSFACVLSLQYVVGALQDTIVRYPRNFPHAFFLPLFHCSLAVAAVAALYHEFSCYNYWELLASGVWRHVLPLPLTLHQGKRSRLIGIPVFAFIIAVVDAVLVFRDPTLKVKSGVLAILKRSLQLHSELKAGDFSRHGKDTLDGSTTNLLSYIRLSVEVLLVAGVCASFALARFFREPQHDGDELREATRSNDILGVKLLLARGMDPNACSGDGTTALHVCGQQAMDRVAYVLLNHGADANVRDRLGFTPLHWAVQMRREEVSTASRLSTIQILLHHGADPRKLDVSGITPLLIASRKENEASLGVLKDFLPEDEITGEAETTDIIDESTRENSNFD